MLAVLGLSLAAVGDYVGGLRLLWAVLGGPGWKSGPKQHSKPICLEGGPPEAAEALFWPTICFV